MKVTVELTINSAMVVKPRDGFYKCNGAACPFKSSPLPTSSWSFYVKRRPRASLGVPHKFGRAGGGAEMCLARYKPAATPRGLPYRI